ncbi:MAG TPA: hypothetical protein VKB79_20880 [Bryobacteraceae bacterium]|nr:hypothetical protein [Bryobacteraceae bacterium]
MAALRTLATASLFFALVIAGACRGKYHRAAVENEEPASGPRLAASLKMGDPTASAQLVKGLYGVESGSWRWTSGHFSILLRSPLAAAQRGGTLTFSFTIPDVVYQKLGKITMTVSSGGKKLNSDSFGTAGVHTLTADVPADLLIKDSVTFDFDLDKALPPSGAESRELGVIATAISLESK